STWSQPHCGQRSATGRAQVLKLPVGKLAQPKNSRFALPPRRSTISPPHSGHSTPVFVKIGLAFRHFGKSLQPRKRPKRPDRIAIRLPHFSHASSLISTGTLT